MEKRPGINNIQAELLKAGIDYATTKVKCIMDTVWIEEKTRRKWRKGLIVKLPKNGIRRSVRTGVELRCCQSSARSWGEL